MLYQYHHAPLHLLYLTVSSSPEALRLRDSALQVQVLDSEPVAIIESSHCAYGPSNPDRTARPDGRTPEAALSGWCAVL